MKLEVRDLTVYYGECQALHRLSFSLDANQWLMIVGPNGAGKSSLIEAIAQGIQYEGSVWHGNENLAKFKPAELARRIGVLSQKHTSSYSFTVGEVVRLGRYAHRKRFFSKSTAEEERHVKEALEITGMLLFEDKSVLSLSGGELQRVFLAQVFAQDPQILILDEPSNHLDLVYQKQMFELIVNWVKKTGRSVISVMHDLSLARAYGTKAMLLDRGHQLAFGESEEVLSRKNLELAYSMDVYAWMQWMLSQWEDRRGEDLFVSEGKARISGGTMSESRECGKNR